MRNFDFDRDALRLELLPEGWEKEPISFTHRATATREASGNPYTLQIVVTTATLSFLMLIGLRAFILFTPFTAELLSWRILALVSLFSLTISVPSFLRGDPPSVWMNRLLFPFVVHLTLFYITQPTWALLILVFVLILAAGDTLAGNYLAWLTADARVDFDTRELIKTRWRNRFGKEAWFAAMMGLFGGRAAPRVLDLYPARALLITVGLLVALVAPGGLGGGMLAVFGLLGWFLFLGVFLPQITGQRPVRLKRQLLTAKRAIENWFNYNPRERIAPGLHQSPFGGATRRVALAVVVLAATSAGLNLVASYFPITAFRYGATPWAWTLAVVGYDQQASERGLVAKFAEWLKKEKEQGSRFRDREFGAGDLNNRERGYYQQLPESKREDYLRLVEKRRKAARASVVVRDSHHRLVLKTPESWMLPNLLGALGGRGFFIWTFILSFFLGALIPPLLLFLAFWALLGYDLAILEYRSGHGLWLEHVREPGGESKESLSWYNPAWLGYVNSIHNSTNHIERESIFLGFAQDFVSDDEVPVLMHRAMLAEHVHITGDSGSGKTSRGISAVAAQLARFSGERKDCSIVVIDLKGDAGLFHGLRREAEWNGLPFKWYRDQLGCSTYPFNPLLQSHIPLFRNHQRARMVMDAFGLRQSDDFGARYFADVQESVIRRVFEKDGEKIRSMADMHRLLQAGNARARYCPDMPQRDWENGFHVREQLGAFAGCPPLNDQTEDSERRIDMASVFVEPQIVYFWVPALLGGGANQQAAKFALYSLLTAAIFLQPNKRKMVHCFIDEFQEIVGANLGVILRQARSFDIGMVLSNQTPYDLNRGGVDMATTLSGAIGFRWSFRATNLRHLKDIQDASGEYVRWILSKNLSRQVNSLGETSATAGASFTEKYRPHYESNELLYTNFVDDLSIAHFLKGMGYTQFFRPFPLKTMFHISKELHQWRSREESWPLLPFPPGSGGGRSSPPERGSDKIDGRTSSELPS